MGNLFGSTKKAAPPSKITEQDRAIAVRLFLCVYVLQRRELKTKRSLFSFRLLSSFFFFLLSVVSDDNRYKYSSLFTHIRQKIKGQRNRMMQYQKKVKHSPCLSLSLSTQHFASDFQRHHIRYHPLA
jgi:hypothetical protein